MSNIQRTMHTLCPALCDPVAEPRSGHLSTSLETSLLTCHVLSSFTLFPNTQHHISHPFVPAIIANQRPDLDYLFLPCSLPLCVSTPPVLLSDHSLHLHVVSSSSPALPTPDLVRLQRYPRPPIRGRPNCPLFSRVQKDLACSCANLPCLPTIRIHCTFPYISSIEHHLNIW